jgi:hypothetical protein
MFDEIRVGIEGFENLQEVFFLLLQDMVAENLLPYLRQKAKLLLILAINRFAVGVS